MLRTFIRITSIVSFAMFVTVLTASRLPNLTADIANLALIMSVFGTALAFGTSAHRYFDHEEVEEDEHLAEVIPLVRAA